MPTLKGKKYSYDKKCKDAYKKDLRNMVARPTGQGFGAARKGPSIEGPEENVVVDFEPGKIIEY